MSVEWKQHLAAAMTSLDELLERLRLDRDQLPPLSDKADRFPLRVPREYVDRMRPGDPADPLLLQVLPLAVEHENRAGFTRDPLAEGVGHGGLLRKYRGRALLVLTGGCAVHCRYCFRRHFPYGEATALSVGLDSALAQLAADEDCREIILSGGDPLVVDDGVLARLASRLAEIPQLCRLRVHSRLPVLVPSRINADLLTWLGATRLQPVLVLHVNHPAEIDERVAAALLRARAAGVSLLNQSVLLAGVNDSVATLCELSERLFAVGVMPYYLHCLDRVAGAAHFAVDDREAVALVAGLRARLPGYLVPRLVREQPGASAKTPLAW